jgi:hypothetical protein
MICGHLAEYYPGQGIPSIFCVLDDDEIPPDATVISTPSDTGDCCHREIDGTSRQALKRFYRSFRTIERFQICDETGVRPLTVEDVKKIAT